MAEGTGIKKTVEQVVSQVLESYVPRLRDELVQRVLEQVQSGAGPGSASSAGELLRAVSLIHAGGTQREILRALLDSAAQHCGRVALFVVKAGTATGWQGRGFDESDAIKDFAIDVSSGLGARALQDRTVARGRASEVDGRFIEQFKRPADSQVLILPLVLKDKVAALVYADSGSKAGNMDAVALELLVASTSAWLEVALLRKQAPKDAGAVTPTAERMQAPVPVQTVSSYVDPFASHSPTHAAAGMRARTEGASAAVAGAEASERESQAEEAAVVAASVAVAAAEAPQTNLPPADVETHRKAQRFAKLLVDEIKLYNQAKVAEGRKHKDLYDRLKEDIDKSRATYQRRYGNTAAASGDYFNSEVVRSLAEDDPGIMGANFRR
jgi:hypothetical protein